MKIYSKRAFENAQHMAREAVKGGSEQGYNFDWECAMISLKTAYGFTSLEFAAAFYGDEE
ncbi:hypothetical protein [Hafnia phage Pocis76]|uniref:Uncharacterized protein n=1 Tax=Hafnia phage Pocis76 TaxID=2831174 RepID=A0A8E7FN30_9CAUD|nr:hypothetical protein [Hafnia phage Pocis76]